jgi:hypothetical protein
MDAIKATVKDRRLELQVPSTWPDGTEVIVQPINHDAGVGIREADWLETPDAVAEWEKWYASLEPLIFTNEEQANWKAARQEQERFEKATFAGRADRLGRGWE